jgi:excisionase family DNA binding protein
MTDPLPTAVEEFVCECEGCVWGRTHRHRGSPAPAREGEYTVGEVSRILRLSRMATYRAVCSGQIPSVKIGRAVRVPVAAVKAILGEPIDERGEAA